MSITLKVQYDRATTTNTITSTTTTTTHATTTITVTSKKTMATTTATTHTATTKLTIPLRVCVCVFFFKNNYLWCVCVCVFAVCGVRASPRQDLIYEYNSHSHRRVCYDTTFRFTILLVHCPCLAAISLCRFPYFLALGKSCRIEAAVPAHGCVARRIVVKTEIIECKSVRGPRVQFGVEVVLAQVEQLQG